MNKIIKIAAALAAIGTMAQANAASTSIMIDPDGAGGMSAISVDSLNWLAGNVLTIGAGGTQGQSAAAYSASLADGSAVLRSVYQAQLNTFVSNVNGNTVSTSMAAGQWTVQADFFERAQAIALGASSIALTPFTGTVSIYYNPTVAANDVTGTGYNLGTKILQGTVLPGSTGSFTNFTFLAPAAFPVTGLDQFGPTDDAPGIQSVRGSGQSTLMVGFNGASDFVDSNFFKNLDVNAVMSLLAVDAGQLTAPFFNTNPSDAVVGITPTYGAGGTTNGFSAQVDQNGIFTETSSFHFQSLNITSFSVPEPTSMAITGLGLGLMGLLRRRKAA